MQIVLEKPDLKVMDGRTQVLEKIAEFVGLSVDEVRKLKNPLVFIPAVFHITIWRTARNVFSAFALNVDLIFLLMSFA